MRIEKALVFAGIVSAFAFPHDCFAEGQESVKKDNFNLGQVVVTATRSSVALSDVPASVSVVPREEIEMSPFEKAEDILRAVPGVEVGMHYGAHITAGNRPVNIRGLGGYGDRTLVLVDGVPQNNANNGWVEWSQIPPESIEKIEIVKGPFSALYGSNAMGGVINIITKEPAARRETIVEQKYGSLDTWSTKISQSEKCGRISYYLNAGYGESDGYIAATPQKTYDTKRSRKENNYVGKIIYDVDDISRVAFGFSSYHADMNRGRKFFYGKTKNHRVYSNYGCGGDAADFLATLYLNHDEWDSNFDSAPAYNLLYRNELIPMQALGTIIQTDIELTEGNSLAVGVDYKHSKLEKKDTYFTVVRSGGVEGKQHCASLFFDDGIRLWDDKLFLNIGARYDWIKSYDGSNWDTNPAPSPAYANTYDSEAWEQLSPKIGLAYHLYEKTIFRSSLGSGFKAPSLYELYTSLTRGPTYIQCNPELAPEKIISYDLGIEHWFSERLCAKTTFYQSFAKDFIGYNTISPTNWKRENISKVGICGIENELSWRITDVWSGFANYVYNKSKIEKYEPDPAVEGNILPDTPQNKYALGLTFDKPELFACNVIFNYKDKRYSDNDNTAEMGAYGTVDLKLSKQLGENCRLSLDIENLSDKEYVIYKGTDQDTIAPGRIITGTAKINF